MVVTVMGWVKWFIAAFIAVLTTLALPAGHAVAQTRSLEWIRLDCDITVLPNGDLRIIETHVVDFIGGPFTSFYRDIKMDRLTAVSAVKVMEDGESVPFKAEEVGGSYHITYDFSPAVDQERTFVIAYTVSGAIRYYSDGDLVWWTAVYPDRNGYLVRNSRVTVQVGF